MSTLNVEAISHPTSGSLVTINGTAPSNRNKIINGDMRIDQRNAGAAVTSSTAYPVDRWINYGATDGTYTGQQSTDVPTGQGFSNSLKYTVTTADATIGATQYASIGQRIEGYNTADLMLGTANAKQFTVSFWVKSSVAGTYGFALQNTAGDRGYATTYSIASTDTWEYKTLVITGDTTGTWLSDNSTGLRTTWGLGIGSTYTVSANNTWEAGIKFGAVGATNLMATLNATFYITGVQLEVGSVATPFEHRSYGDELARCERYYQVIKGGAGVFTSNAAFIAMNFSPMRVTPTFTADGVLKFTDVIQADYTQSSAQLVVGAATDRSGTTDARNLSTPSGRVAIFVPNNGNYINASAEL
jgi:hypothetical protein